MTSKSNSNVPVVVLPLDCKAGLQAARTFGERGVPVFGVATDTDSFLCRTRHVIRVVRAELDGPGLHKALFQLLNEIGGKAVLWPCSDNAVMRVSRDRETLAEHFLFQLPPHDIIRDVMEKSHFYRRAVEEELPIPSTIFVSKPQDVELACETMKFPCVLKPSFKSDAWLAATNGTKAYKVHDAAELRRLVAQVGFSGTILIVQEWIEGDDGDLFSCYTYVNEDLEMLAVAVARKIRQWPIDTGNGCSSRICDVPEIVEVTRRLCQKMKCWGLIFVQYKWNPRDGRYVIMEPHVGRPGLGMFVSEAAGVEMQYTMYCDLLNLEFSGSPIPVRDDAVWLDLYSDCRSALTLRHRGELNIWSWLQSLRGRRRMAVLSWTDPLPFILESRYLLNLSIRRLTGRFVKLQRKVEAL